jgi:hypothetical protein
MVKMNPEHASDGIDLAKFNDVLDQYSSVVPSSLSELEEQRLTTLPKVVDGRSPKHITRDELSMLMQWKLKHGRFRPTLMGLVNKNTESEVINVTTEAFAMPLDSATDVKAALAALTKLKGIGPATASLLLSVKAPEYVPFFSDELYRWACWNSTSGWKQEIKYTEKVYLELFDRVQKVRDRVSSDLGGKVSALDVEKVAYVLGKQAVGGDDVQARAAESGKRKALGADVGARKTSAGQTEDVSITKRPRRRMKK